MVWSGYAVLMSGKTDSIKLNNISGCLPGSTFVYSEVFKLDFSFFPSFLHTLEITLSSQFCYSCLDTVLVSEMYSRAMVLNLLPIKTKDKDRGIMGLAVAGLAGLRRCWHHQSSAWYISGMLQVSSPRRSNRMLEMSAR
ncbi:hypothetical protein Tco_1329781 [Tanacetum coccineum]